MLRSRLLSSIRPFYAPDDEGKKTPSELAAEERAKIKISDSTNKDNTNKDDKEDDDKSDKDDKSDDDKKSDDSEKDEEIEGDETGDDDTEKDEEDDKKEQSLEDKDKELERLKKQVARLERRTGKTAGERDQLKKDLKEAKAALDAKVKDGEQPLTEEEVNRRAKDIAEQTVTQNEFNRMQEDLISDAKKIDKNFMTKINNLAEEVAPLPGLMIPALNELDNENGGAVLNYLTENPDEYEEILTLKSPTKIINKLIKISDKLADEKKPKPKKISQAPDPAKKDIGGNASKNNDTLPAKPTENMKDYVRIRAKQVEQRRREKLGLA